MDWIIQILRDLLYGFLCAVPFSFTKRYIARLLLCIVAPLAVTWWAMWSLASWSAYQYIEINRHVLVMAFGGFCAAQMRLLWSAWASDEGQKAPLTASLMGLSTMAGLLVSLLSATSATGLIMSVTSGIQWDAYFLIVTAIVTVSSCAAWRYGLNTAAFIWTSALGGYVGSLVAAWHRDWDILEATISRGHYDWALNMLMLSEYFLFAVGGALAGVLMLGLSKALSLWRFGSFGGEARS